MIVPPPLQPGHKVAVVCPASSVSRDEFQAGCEVIRSWGLELTVGPSCTSQSGTYLSGTDEERMLDLQTSLDDPDIRAIFCGRGGYGMTRILDRLDFSKMMERPKWIVGFSDITALHLRVQSLDVESLHACMPIQYDLPKYQASVGQLKALLFGVNSYQIGSARNEFNRHGNASGQIVGGNLSLLVDSMGTSSEVNTESKILFLEEIDEPIYKVDRMFMHLLRAGKLDHLAGLILGHFTGIKDMPQPFAKSIEALILEKVTEKSFPVAFGFPIGHDAPNIPVRCHATVTLEVKEQASLTFS